MGGRLGRGRLQWARHWVRSVVVGRGRGGRRQHVLLLWILLLLLLLLQRLLLHEGELLGARGPAPLLGQGGQPGARGRSRGLLHLACYHPSNCLATAIVDLPALLLSPLPLAALAARAGSRRSRILTSLIESHWPCLHAAVVQGASVDARQPSCAHLGVGGACKRVQACKPRLPLQTRAWVHAARCTYARTRYSGGGLRASMRARMRACVHGVNTCAGTPSHPPIHPPTHRLFAPHPATPRPGQGLMMDWPSKIKVMPVQAP